MLQYYLAKTVKTLYHSPRIPIKRFWWVVYLRGKPRVTTMTLDDLPWLTYGGNFTSRAGEWVAVAHVSLANMHDRCRVYRQRSGMYDIITDYGDDRQWYNIDALTAQ